jgi:thiol:disulfide interchange protein
MPTAEQTAITWSEDVDQALAEAKKSGKPLILDFTAAPM